MAKGTRGRCRTTSRQSQGEPYPSPSGNHSSDMNEKKCSKKSEKKFWDDAICSVCMEYPHKAVLLLCSSHDKGCRPYMCGTSFRYSNCLKQYKKAYTKVTFPQLSQSLHGSTSSHVTAPGFSTWHAGKCEIFELACPLCRGQVKGWTVVEPAREYLNAKKRSCMHDNCLFAGNYKEMRKHVRAEHPSARPREINPVVEQKWTQLERERERDDVITAVTSAMPGAVVYGDYVIGENDSEDEDEDEDEVEVEQNEDFGMGVDGSWMSFLLFLQAFGSARGSRIDRDTRQHGLDSNHGSGEGDVRIDDYPLLGSFGCPNEDGGGIVEDVHDNDTTTQH